MAKKELLRALKIILIAGISIAYSTQTLAQEQLNELNEDYLKQAIITDKKFENDLKNTMDKIKKSGRASIVKAFTDLKITQGKENEIDYLMHPQANLKIFVSSSMPVALLRQYHEEAAIYGGTLIFKGLPGGSFKELTKLVMEITEEGEAGAMQIDDEAFAKFNITSVPAFVLAKEGECFANKDCVKGHDKIVGNIGIRAALEHFIKEGDLSENAQELLVK